MGGQSADPVLQQVDGHGAKKKKKKQGVKRSAMTKWQKEAKCEKFREIKPHRDPQVK